MSYCNGKIMNDEGLKCLVERIKMGFGDDLLGVILFGSRGRHEAKLSSDYDLFLIIKSLPKRPIERQEFIMEKVKKKGKVNFIAKTKEEFESSFPSLYLDLALDGVILFDKDGYTHAKIVQIRKLIDEAGLVREKKTYGFNWRWLRNPALHWRIDWSGVYGIV
ncbi:MAG: nucleotidyltransferase domain-containing protein [bacterium]